MEKELNHLPPWQPNPSWCCAEQQRSLRYWTPREIHPRCFSASLPFIYSSCVCLFYNGCCSRSALGVIHAPSLPLAHTCLLPALTCLLVILDCVTVSKSQWWSVSHLQIQCQLQKTGRNFKISSASSDLCQRVLCADRTSALISVNHIRKRQPKIVKAVHSEWSSALHGCRKRSRKTPNPIWVMLCHLILFSGN